MVSEKQKRLYEAASTVLRTRCLDRIGATKRVDIEKLLFDQDSTHDELMLYVREQINRGLDSPSRSDKEAETRESDDEEDEIESASGSDSDGTGEGEDEGEDEDAEETSGGSQSTNVTIKRNGHRETMETVQVTVSQKKEYTVKRKERDDDDDDDDGRSEDGTDGHDEEYHDKTSKKKRKKRKKPTTCWVNNDDFTRTRAALDKKAEENKRMRIAQNRNDSTTPNFAQSQ
jgi:hypothetical protein